MPLETIRCYLGLRFSWLNMLKPIWSSEEQQKLLSELMAATIVHSCHQNDNATLKMTIKLSQEAISFPANALFDLIWNFRTQLSFSSCTLSFWMRIFHDLAHRLLQVRCPISSLHGRELITCIHMRTLVHNVVFYTSRRKACLGIFAL